MENKDTSRFKKELAEAIRGDLLSDDMSLWLYSTDASLYQIKPIAVVLPRTHEDILKTIEIASRHEIPVMGRGGGTSLAGQTVTRGIVIDLSKYMNRVIELNEEERWVKVQPGIVLDNLNDFLKPYGLFFAPDVATASRANVGGMIGNNSSGVRSVQYGKTVDHVEALRVALSTGDHILFEELNEAQLGEKISSGEREGEIYQKIVALIDENRSEIEKKFPRVMRRVSGYNLDELLDSSHFNLAKLLVGSEGTLGVITEARLNLEPIPPERAVAVLHFDDLLTAIASVKDILRYNPSAVEVLDHYGLELAYGNPAVASLCRQFIQGDPQAVLIVEFAGNSKEEVKAPFEQMKEDRKIRKEVFYIHEAWTMKDQETVWQVRKNALGVMLGIKGDFKPLPFIEDSGIPVEHLAEYISKIQQLCDKHNRRLALYAHASVGVIHVRPLLNLKQEEDVEILQSISEETFDLVRHYGGSWSGEHGDGLVRSYKIREFFGDQLYSAFEQVKKTFDPVGLMNPGKIINSPPMIENLRIHPDYKTEFPPTYYYFEAEGGLDRAVELCTGVGQCRKTLSGIMCPSYIATLDEEHSTRGRANALRTAITKGIDSEKLTSHRLYEVLDLCLECKACKSECPSSVDMAKMKAEFLGHYYDAHGMPVGKKLVAATRNTAELASKAPALVNFFSGNALSRFLLEKFAGFDRRRTPPRYASRSFSRRKKEFLPLTTPSNPRGKVLLFVDTFANYYQPEIAEAALRLLYRLGYETEIVDDAGCCGRPLISSGALGKARMEGNEVVKNLAARGEGHLPILVLEPSCFSTFKDDLTDLVEDRNGAQQVAKRMLTLDEFLTTEENSQSLKEIIAAGPEKILYHGHCQQKAEIGSEVSLRLLEQIPESLLEEVPAGCCGMAGSFGYEKGHYEISEKIGERHLLPAVREEGEHSTIVVPGFSCRSQIEHFTGRHALHPVELLARCLKHE